MTILLIVGLFVGIVLDRYLFQVGDVYLQIFSLKKQLVASKIQREIHDINETMGGGNVSAIGYQYEPEYDCECEEDDDGCGKIGFRSKV